MPSSEKDYMGNGVGVSSSIEMGILLHFRGIDLSFVLSYKC
jgi:hypothetical protein